MGRLRDFGLDVAWYFGVGEGSEARRSSGEELDLGDILRVVVVVPAAFLLERVLDLEASRFLVTLGLVVVLGVVWGLVLRMVSTRQSNRGDIPGGD